MEAVMTRGGLRRESVGWSIGLGVLLIVIGLLALAAPLLAGVALTSIFAWFLLLGGVAHLVFAWHLRHAGGLVWELLVGLAYIVMGVFLFLHPVAGLVTLTVFLGAYLAFKGVAELVGWFAIRHAPGSGWLLFGGIISLVLAGMIFAQLPFSAAWVPGTLIGIAILFSGVSRLALGMSARRTHLLTV